MAVRSIADLSPITDSMVVTTPVDSSNYTTSRLGETSNVRIAQPFFATQPYLSNVTFRKGNQTGTYVGTVKVSIQAGSPSTPSGTDLVSRTYTNAQWIALSTDTDVTVTLRTPLTVGTRYFIVFTSSTSDNLNYTRVFGNVNSAVQNLAGERTLFNGSVWTGGGGALYFKITSGPAYYTEVARTPISTSRTTATNRVAVRDMGTALRFGAVATDKVTATYIPNLGINGSFSCWFIWNTTFGTAGTILNNSISSTDRFVVGITTNGEFAGLYNDGTNVASISTTRLVANIWYFGVYTKEGTTGKVYLNGVVPSTASGQPATSSGSALIIGGRGGSSSPFIGIIDEPRIWNRALTATEVSNMYFNNIVPRNGLVAEYLFNETTGLVALDSSGNGNNGTITGATYTLDVPLRERTAI